MNTKGHEFVDCGDMSPLSDGATCRPVTKRGHARALQRGSRAIAIGVLLLAGCAGPRGLAPLANYDFVSPQVRRSAQPNKLGFYELRRLGVRSVVNLRGDPLPDEAATCASLGLCYTNLPLGGLLPPTERQLDVVLAAMDALPKPVLVHCQWGCERTGEVIAHWRVQREGWTKANAYREAKEYGSRWR